MERDPLTHPDSAQVLYRPLAALAALPPLPATSDQSPYAKECRTFWAEQRRRCLHGWTAPDGKRLHGFLYFCLNFGYTDVALPGEMDEVWERLLYRKVLEEFADALWFARRRKVGRQLIPARNVGVAKGRRAGWTVVETLYTVYCMVFDGGRPVARIYPDDENISQERDIIRRAFNELPTALRMRQVSEGPKVLEWVTDNEGEMALGHYPPRPDGRPDLTRPRKLTSCYFYIGGPKSGKGRGFKFNLVTVVEAGKHANILGTYSTNKHAMGRGRFKFGQYVVGGTSDAIDNPSPDYGKFVMHPATYGSVSVFMSAARLVDYDYFTGESLEAEGRAFLEAERAKVEDDPIEYLKELQERPLHLSECFIPPTRSAYPRHKIDEQVKFLLERRVAQTRLRRGRLLWEQDVYAKRTGRVTWKDDATGPWQVYEGGFPRPDIKGLDFATFDDYFRDKKVVKPTDSLAAIEVYRAPSVKVAESDLPIALYLERPPSLQDVYDEALKCTLFWGCELLYELHNSSAFPQYMQKKGHYDKLIHVNGEPGVLWKGAQEAEATQIAQEYFRDDRHRRIYFMEILDGYKNWGVKNTDAGSCAHLRHLKLDMDKGSAPEWQAAGPEALARFQARFGPRPENRPPAPAPPGQKPAPRRLAHFG